MFNKCCPTLLPRTPLHGLKRRLTGLRTTPGLRTTSRSATTTISSSNSGSHSDRTTGSSSPSVHQVHIQFVNVTPVVTQGSYDSYVRSLNEWKNQQGLTPKEDEGRKKAVELILNLQPTHTTLDLSDLHLSQIPPLWFCSHLRRINLSYNDITTINQNAFSGLSSLETLDLSHNLISTITQNSFSGLSSLETLILSHNPLPTITQNVFSALTTLEKLVLSNTYLSKISDSTFSGLTSLQVLDLGYNPLSAIPQNAFSGLSSLIEIWLHPNPNFELFQTDYLALQQRNVKIHGYRHPNIVAIGKVYATAGRHVLTPFDWSKEDNFAGFLNLLQRLTTMDYFNNDSTKVEAYSSLCDLLDKMAFSSPLRQVCFNLAHSFTTDCEDAIAVGFFQMQIHAAYSHSIYKQTETTTLDQTSKTHFYNLALDLAKLDVISTAASDIAQILGLGDVIELQLKLLIECRHQFPNVTLSHMNYPGMATVVTPEIIALVNTVLQEFSTQPLAEHLQRAVIQQLADFPAVHDGCKFDSISDRVYENSHEPHPDESEHDYIVRCNQAKVRYEQETTKAVRDFFF